MKEWLVVDPAVLESQRREESGIPGGEVRRQAFGRAGGLDERRARRPAAFLAAPDFDDGLPDFEGGPHFTRYELHQLVPAHFSVTAITCEANDGA
ncbi:MAG: hypothetical protein ACJ74Q_15530 [Pyrinomonadaceae bacterium]